MKRFAMFALFVCLMVLAIAVVHGLTNPEMTDSIFDFLRDIWERFVIFLEYAWEGLRAAFAPRT